MDGISIIGSGDSAGCIYFRDSLDGLPALVRGHGPVFLIYDNNVSSFASSILSSAEVVSSFGVDVSEVAKTLATVEGICSWLLESGADRNAVLVAVGGGILTDMAGFAAAVYKRGIKAVYVPTTLLAQVDASVGGKTGVNFRGFKNILGVVRQPLFTYICPRVLETLPYGHILEGAAEMIKTFIIKDGGNYRKAVSLFSSLAESGGDSDAVCKSIPDLEGLVRAAVEVKAEIVSEDQFEGGVRRKLNLGHTFAHAIEWCSHSISHGQAVSMGIVLAARLSEKLSLCRPGLAQMIACDLERCGLAVVSPFPVARLHDAMLKDKKSENGKIYFVLIRDTGDTEVVPLSAEMVIKLLETE